MRYTFIFGGSIRSEDQPFIKFFHGIFSCIQACWWNRGLSKVQRIRNEVENSKSKLALWYLRRPAPEKIYFPVKNEESYVCLQLFGNSGGPQYNKIQKLRDLWTRCSNTTWKCADQNVAKKTAVKTNVQVKQTEGKKLRVLTQKGYTEKLSHHLPSFIPEGKSESRISDDLHHPHAHRVVLLDPWLQAVNHRWWHENIFEMMWKKQPYTYVMQLQRIQRKTRFAEPRKILSKGTSKVYMHRP